MSFDTDIAVALIALFGALLSGILAYVGSNIAAKVARDTQIKTAAQEAFISARLNAFLAYEEAFETWAKDKTKESCSAVYRAENIVRIVGSDETIVQLAKLTNYVRLFEATSVLPLLDKVASAHAAALLAMRNDLMHYPVPTPELNQNQSRIECTAHADQTKHAGKD